MVRGYGGSIVAREGCKVGISENIGDCIFIFLWPLVGSQDGALGSRASI